MLPSHLRSFVREHWQGVLALGIAVGVAVWFATGIIGEFLYFNDPKHQDVALKGWMTPKYVVLTYDLPRSYVADTLGLLAEDQRGMPMRDVAAQMGVTLPELTQIVREAAAEFRAGEQ